MKSHMTNAAVTAIKMLETLPEDVQEYVVDRMREAVATFQEERKWDRLFKKKRKALAKMVQRVRRDTNTDEVEEMDYDRL